MWLQVRLTPTPTSRRSPPSSTRAAISKGDILPIVARELPELGRRGRPLKNWGAPQ
jgi:hypothetical protein